MTIQDRLIQHYNGSHNNELNEWIRCSHQLGFEYEIVEDPLAIPAKERIWTRRLKPLTNKRVG